VNIETNGVFAVKSKSPSLRFNLFDTSYDCYIFFETLKSRITGTRSTALTEVGPGNGLPREHAIHFFTKRLLGSLKKDELAGRIAYALVWGNSSSGHFWVPPPNHPDAEDLLKFRKDPVTLFEDDLPNVYKTSQPVQK